MANETPAQQQQFASLRTNLAGGFADLKRFKDTLVEQMKAGESKAASAAFQNLYRKSGAMEAAMTAADKLHRYHLVGNGALWATAYFRQALDVLGGSWRESQEVVIGDAVLKDGNRKTSALDGIEHAWSALIEALETEARENKTMGKVTLCPEAVK